MVIGNQPPRHRQAPHDPVLAADRLEVAGQPGDEVRARVSVTNIGDQVEDYHWELLGPARGWSQVLPDRAALMPGASAQVQVTFALPVDPPIPPGHYPFGVRVWSGIDAARCAVVEGDLDVGAVTGLACGLQVVGGAGSHRGRFCLVLHNTGSAPVPVRVTPALQDGSDELSFAVHPDRLEVPPGGWRVVYCLVRPRHPALVGPVRERPFRLVCRVEGRSEAHEVGGAFRQRPVIPAWLFRAVVVLLLVIVACVGVLRWHAGAGP